MTIVPNAAAVVLENNYADNIADSADSQGGANKLIMY